MKDEGKTQKLITLEKVLGAEITFHPLQNNNFKRPQQLSIASPILHSQLVNFFDSSEKTFFTTSINVNRLVKYGDGSISSMVKGIKGIDGHQGFDFISSIELANDLFQYIGNAFNNAVASIYTDYVEQVNFEINNVYRQFALNDFSRLKSISFFLREVYSDINDTGFTKEQAQATLTNTQRSRIELRELLYKYLELIRSNISPWQGSIPINDLANNYFNSRFCISLYVISLMAETILSNRLDDNGFKSLKEKTSTILNEFNNLTSEVNNKLESRFYDNQRISNPMTWAYNYFTAQQKLDENIAINNFASNNLSYFCEDAELKKIDEVFSIRDKLLSDIIITSK